MKRTALGFCVVSLFAVVSAAGCSSSGGPVSGSSGGSNGNGSGGNSASGGNNGNGSGGNSASGGSNGSGGSESNGSGGSSSGSGGATTACAAATGAPITDFAGSGGQVGTPYTGADMGLTAPKATVADGALTIEIDTGMATTDYPYAYIGLGFAACTSGSTYQGVTFNVSGTLTPETCTIQFSSVDKEHNTATNGGTCMADSCYPSAKIFPLSSSATDVTVNFLDQTGGGADTGAAVVDPGQLTAIQWQINIPKGGSCTGSIKIDNVTFK